MFQSEKEKPTRRYWAIPRVTEIPSSPAPTGNGALGLVPLALVPLALVPVALVPLAGRSRMRRAHTLG